MALEPRFRRVAAMDRRFVDRESAVAAFDTESHAIGDRTRVLNVTGVGGIGKSRLLRELRARTERRGLRTATLDLQLPAVRQHEDALAVLRTEFGKQGVRFDRFDIAYSVLWHKLHPQIKIGLKDLPFANESDVLAQILGDSTGIPVVGTAVGLARLAERKVSSTKRRKLINGDETLRRLDDLSNAELLDAVTYLFAEDLREYSAEESYVVFVDAYEALAPAPIAPGRVFTADSWLRDLVAQLDRGLVVIASREPLRWQTHHADWAEIIRPCPIHGLPMPARLELLAEGGGSEQAALRAIANASQGLPFYLHLAIDTRAAPRRAEESVVSSEEILQRFLQHVEQSDVRTFELLSISRVFDREIFQALAGAYHLPYDRLRWESLASYSFVFPVGMDAFRLHQLMSAALRDRLSGPVTAEVHVVLRRVWDQRAETGGDPGIRARALREAVYHGVHSGAMRDDTVLGYADRAIKDGGKQVVDGMAVDIRQYLALAGEDDEQGTRLAEVARCLESEAAVLMGDAARAVELTPGEHEIGVSSLAGARLAVAAAHARRIAGDTAEANRIYSAVWERDHGPTRHTAGLWVADLHMCQGRFSTALSLAEEALAGSPAEDEELRGDLERLRHLGYRFHLDFDHAATALDRAELHYRAAGANVGLANIATNRTELLAWTDPEIALSSAPAALEAQQGLAAWHELGKIHTAVALCQLRLSRHDEATESFETAFEYLDRARYRSGRARAEFFRGFLYARSGRLDPAVESISLAVRELVAADVYPTMVVMAGHALRTLDRVDPAVARAASAARDAIAPLDSTEELERRMTDLVDLLLGMR